MVFYGNLLLVSPSNPPNSLVTCSTHSLIFSHLGHVSNATHLRFDSTPRKRLKPKGWWIYKVTFHRRFSGFKFLLKMEIVKLRCLKHRGSLQISEDSFLKTPFLVQLQFLDGVGFICWTLTPYLLKIHKKSPKIPGGYVQIPKSSNLPISWNPRYRQGTGPLKFQAKWLLLTTKPKSRCAKKKKLLGWDVLLDFLTPIWVGYKPTY